MSDKQIKKVLTHLTSSEIEKASKEYDAIHDNNMFLRLREAKTASPIGVYKKCTVLSIENK